METLFKNGTARVKNATAVVGIYTATSGDATANAAVIDLSADLAVLETCVFQIIRAGKVATSDAALTISGATLTFGDGSTFNLTAGDVIHYTAAGSLTN